ncbi:hypothetical protein [Sandaracinus amylolyticus]|uniref:Uncharacterized protein n=1 Tax=Sandaracinus amylolyticus TaxID=927083 RepID=A0A0F6YJL2_9BACT|nr:hypothetical protein [Sandaracinus amylolyticus]AKF06222.1 hypothetical protein DB32_003371 [Sandaracinus amylolyticus]
MITPALRDAIEQLYRVFARYPRPRAVEGCPCCVTDADRARLHRAPLRDLRAEDLSRYAFKALSTWGDARDFRHFLPRILEIVCDAHDDLRVDDQIVLGKLRHADWTCWPRDEQDAITRWLDAWWLDVLTGDRDTAWRGATVLSSILATGHPLAPLLATFDVELAQSATARAALLTVVEDLAHQPTLDPWTSNATSDAITRWLASRAPTIERAIDEAYESDRDFHRYNRDAFLLRAQTL